MALIKAVFAGTFDPFTIGHYEVASRAADMFDSVIVAVADDAASRAVVNARIRSEIANESLKSISNVTVKPFGGMLTDFMQGEGVKVLVRGLRDQTDLGYESRLFAAYKDMYPQIECVYLIADPKLAHISSSLVRELSMLGGRIDPYICNSAVFLVKRYYFKSRGE